MKERSRTEYSLINIATNLSGYFVNAILGFVCRIIFVRTLSVDYLGVSGLFTNILSMLSLAELGIGSAIIYALYKPIAEKDETKIAALMKLYGKAYAIIGVIVGVIGLLIMPFLNTIITSPPNIKENLYVIYLLYLTNIVVSYFFSYKGSLLTAMQRNYIVTGYSYIQTILQSILQIIFLLATHEYIYYLIIQIGGGILYNISLSVKANKDYPFISNKEVPPLPKEERKTIFWNVKALTVGKLCQVLVNSTDNVVISFFNGITSVGLASNYILFSSTLNSLITSVFSSLTGSVGNFNATSDDANKYSFFKILNLANFWLYGWGAIGISVVSSDLVKWFYGSDYIMDFKIPLILAINFYTLGMLHASYTYKSTLGLFKYGQYIGLFTGGINIAMDIVLGRMFGVFGIFFATLVARSCTTLWYEPYVIYRYGLHKKPVLYLIRYIKFALVLIFTGAVCWGCCMFLDLPIVVNVFVKIVICSLIPNIVFAFVFHRTGEYDYLKKSVIRIIKKILMRKKL